MQVTPLPAAAPRPRRLAVGTFDGVHLGHRQVIAGADSVLTFDPHPSAVISPHAAPKLLTSLEVKTELIASLGVEELIIIPFDRAFAALGAGQFIEDVLVGRLGATHVSVGENFRFGARAQGDATLLEADQRFATRIVPLIEVEGEIVSSSHIRALVGAGEVEQAARFLGSPFTMRGEVVHGDGRGRELGYPTANLVPADELVCPGHGVYAGRADGRPAAVSIGVRPTFKTGRGELIEAFLLDYEADLYGHRLHLEFGRRLRGERRFGSAQALIAQMKLDVEATRSWAGDG